MGLKAQAIKNVSATWLALLVHAVVGFLLAPFVLHRLGDEAYSIWILIFAVTGYFNLLDFGIRSSIVKTRPVSWQPVRKTNSRVI